MAPGKKVLRIGGASGFWGDSELGPEQMFAEPDIDVVVFDYLAEVTMSILAKAKARDPEAGYAVDFITQVIRPHLRTITDRRIKIITNAGGLNVEACRRAVEALALEAGVSVRVGTVEGDDVLAAIDGWRDRVREMETGAPLPDRIVSANAYLGAFPIAAALEAGADIVITGRCVDSALVVGPIIQTFGWTPDDLDQLAAASLAGHLLECGAQVSGGNFTDWEQVSASWDNTGFPICEVEADGSFVLTKAKGTGGLVSRLTVAEQLVYEIGDPARYILPDVTCDFTNVALDEIGPDRVRVTGARGHSAPPSLKASITYADGFSCVGSFVVAGEKAVDKARAQGEAVLKKTTRMLAARQMPPFTNSELNVIGAESLFGTNANPSMAQSREVVLRLGVQHPTIQGADLFSRELVGAALSMSPGLTMLSPGRPKPSPVIRLYSCLLDRNDIPVSVEVGGKAVGYEPSRPRDLELPRAATPAPAPPLQGELVEVSLRQVAVARSGDKGDKANIGVIARDPAFLPAIRAALSNANVSARFAHLASGEIERFDLPGLHAVNFLLGGALGGGGAASIRLDPQGKTYAQILLDMPIALPKALMSKIDRNV